MAGSGDDLLREAKAGSEAALKALLERFCVQSERRIAASIGTRWQSLLSADDILQVTCLEAVLCFDSFAGDVSGFYAWLQTLARHNLQDAIKGLVHRPDSQIGPTGGENSVVHLIDQLTDSGTSASRRLRRSEALGMLERALHQLPGDYRQVVRLHDLQGLTLAQTAQTMKRSRGAAVMLRRRSLDHLRRLLGCGSGVLSPVT